VDVVAARQAQAGQVTPRQKLLVQTSFTQVLPIADKAGAMIYERLFELDPSLRDLFHIDIREQGRRLMQMVSIAVHGLDSLSQLVPALEALGRRHADYGVTRRHLELGGEALMWTLERGLAGAFTAEVRDAWAAVYAVLMDTMLEGMRKAPARTAA
jgi:hemoglobin-like flavoprotein